MPRSYMTPGLQGALDTATMADSTLLYQVSAPFAGPANMVKITNLSSIDLFIVYGNEGTVLVDNVAINDIVPANTSFIYDFQSNARPSGLDSPMQQGTIVYVRAPAVGVGLVYCTYFYQIEN